VGLDAGERGLDALDLLGAQAISPRGDDLVHLVERLRILVERGRGVGPVGIEAQVALGDELRAALDELPAKFFQFLWFHGSCSRFSATGSPRASLRGYCTF